MAPVNSVFMPVDVILTSLIASLQASSSRITDFHIGSDARTVFEAFATVLSQGSRIADQLQLDSHLDTAEGAALDALGLDNYQVARNPAVQAAGRITITRQSISGAVTILAGWSQLATSPSIPGASGIAVITTEDANFPDTVAAVTVNAQAVQGGQAGNLSATTFLTPLTPLVGIDNQTGYEVTTAFVGGVDAESDDAYRARIPIIVQGRQAKGRPASFLAAALGVPGVLSAAVLGAGATRGDGTTVPVNSVEVYYQGSAGLLSQVSSVVASSATLNQSPSTFASVSLTAPRGQKRVVATATVYCLAGTDTVALAAAVTAALQTYVDSVGIGNTVRVSLAAEAILAVVGVATVDLPFATFNLHGSAGAIDIPIAADSYANLATADTTITVLTL